MPGERGAPKTKTAASVPAAEAALSSPNDPTAASPAAVEAFDVLLASTRGLEVDAAEARDAWLARLGLTALTAGASGTAKALFELEMLLKGLACYANPRNHPGPPHSAPSRGPRERDDRVATRDFREPLQHAEAGLARALVLARTLADDEGARVARRYLAPVVLQRGASAAARPDPVRNVSRALLELREGLSAVLEATRAAVLLPRVPFRVFAALLGLVRKATEQSTFFNPLRQLEFRPEFDRPIDPSLLALPGRASTPAARTLVALIVLALSRMQRYVALIEETARSGAPHAERRTGIVYLMVSVLRSDARALVEHLEHRAGDALAADFEGALGGVPARALAAQFETLRAEAAQATELRAGFESLAARLRLDVRATFGRDFPTPYAATSAPALREAVEGAGNTLSHELHSALARLGELLGLAPEGTSTTPHEGLGAAEKRHLQRDAWMFAQVLRAFAAKARSAVIAEGFAPTTRTVTASAPPSASGVELWSTPSASEFVSPFIAYVRALGVPVLGQARYPRRVQFLGSVAALARDGASAREPLLRVVAEAGPLTTFLLGLVEDLDRSLGEEHEAREGAPFTAFQPRQAAEALRRRLESGHLADTAGSEGDPALANPQSAEGR